MLLFPRTPLLCPLQLDREYQSRKLLLFGVEAVVGDGIDELEGDKGDPVTLFMERDPPVADNPPLLEM